MRGQLAFDLLFGLVILVSLLMVLGNAVEFMSKEVQRMYGYVICETVGNSVANYYGFLLENGEVPPSTREIETYVANGTIHFDGKEVRISLKVEGTAITCSPRRVGR